MTIGPPNVGKTKLKEQLLTNDGENTATVEGVHDRPPSSPVCAEIKRIQILLGGNKKGEESPCAVVVDKYTWNTLQFDEEVIGFLKNISKSTSRFFTKGEILFWTNHFIIMFVCLIIFASVLPEQIREDDTIVSIIRIYDSLMFNLAYSSITITMLALYWIYSYCTKSAKTNIIAITKEALQHNDINKVQPLFDQTFTIYFRDCGGQPEFHEVLPALVSQSTLFFLVFNLSEHLDTQYKVTYKTSNDKVSDSYVSSFTVKQALLQYLASISSIGKYSKPKINRLKSLFMCLWKKLTQLWKKKVKAIVSKVIIIGTHKDLLGDIADADDVVLQRNIQLKDELKDTDWYSEAMIIPVEGRKLLLGINTFSPNDIRKVKDLVNKVALNEDYQLEIPVPWLAFELCIRNLGKKVMPLKECQHLAKECEILYGDEFNAALWFLHNKVGTIRYFKTVPELQNIVITDPQLLFDLVTDLIVNTFSFGKHIERMSEHDRFRSSGRFTKHHLEQCEAVKEKWLSVEQVIAVLEHFVIIAPVGKNESNEQEYFLPCALVHASLLSTPLSHNDSDIPPLLITFKCHYTPRGIFSSLIARILLDGKDKWELSSEEIKRNQANFRLVNSGHIVTITNFFRFLEIGVKPPRGSTRIKGDVYVSIRQYISCCLTDVRHKLNYTATADHFFGFYCKEHTNSFIEDHPAIVKLSHTVCGLVKLSHTECGLVKLSHTVCGLDGNLTAVLSLQQQIWFDKKCEISCEGIIT